MSKTKTIVPPIKSQGIKTKLVPWIKSSIPATTGKWIEPFMGTGVVGFNAGFSKAIMCDINPHLIQFYKDIQVGAITPEIVRAYLEHEGELLLTAADSGYEHYRKVRDRFNKEFSPLDFLFLSRAGFNGMIRFNNKGAWNIPFCKKPNRFSKAYITKIVNQVNDVSKIIQSDWSFNVGSFESSIENAGENDFIYCDPPYIGRYVDYYSGWNEENEHKLFELLSKTRAKFLLSTWHHNDYRVNDYVNKYWNKFHVSTRDHFYHSGAKLENRKSIVEALVANFKLPNFDLHEKATDYKNQLDLLLV